MKTTLFEPVGQANPELTTTDETRLRNELTKLRIVHDFEEKKREARVKRIEEIKTLLGEVPSQDETKRVCGE